LRSLIQITESIAWRRRSFEREAVLIELITRAGLPLPKADLELAPLPLEVPKLPTVYSAREDVIEAIKGLLLSQTAGLDAHGADCPFVVAHGMGGTGKTVTAAAVAHSRELRTAFEKICFVSLGQEASIRDLQRSLHVQLCGTTLDPSMTDSRACFSALQDAAC
jgi:hypothetical protein